jgi:hypothetical protein
LEYEYLVKLRKTHPTLRLLATDNNPLVLSFLFAQFVKINRRSAGYAELTSRLDDYLFQLRDLYGEGIYPKNARRYLEDWSDERSPFLRKYYVTGNDEPQFDLTPATEKAIEWIQDLQTREFVGTESRLLTVLQLLREIVYQSEEDPETRIEKLERRKAEIDTEIDRIRAGRIDSLDPTQVRERFFQAEDTARKLLADFRQVEHNFRELDRATRERIATSDSPKGKLLDEIFIGHDEIHDSDQGRSFRAFWEFLMSPQRQTELEELLQDVFGLEAVQELGSESLLHHIKYFLLEAGEKVFQTNNQLVEQLRKYLDDQAWLENKRIMELIKTIERQAVEIKDYPPSQRVFTEVDELRPHIELIMSRNLFTPPKNTLLENIDLTEGDVEFEMDALFQQSYIDEVKLAANIKRMLQRQKQVSLKQVIQSNPVTKGVAASHVLAPLRPPLYLYFRGYHCRLAPYHRALENTPFRVCRFWRRARRKE